MIMFTLMCIVSLLMVFSPRSVECVEEESISINKPIVRTSASNEEVWPHLSNDDVKCFCNLPACVSTGYMCKSKAGGCFSDLLGHSRPGSPYYRGRHGCLELLTDKEQKKWCDNPKTSNKHPKSLFLCCHSDMCNHLDSPETKNLINNTILSDLFHSSDDRTNRSGRNQQQFLYSDSEVWFRAATIAVPICGAVILFVLIALAVKILRNESPNSTRHKLGPLYVHHYKPTTDKYNENLENLLRCKERHHYNKDEMARQVHVPLLLMQSNEQTQQNNCNADNRNKTNNVAEELLEPSIILELEKDSSTADYNIIRNINKGDEKNYDDIKFT